MQISAQPSFGSITPLHKHTPQFGFEPEKAAKSASNSSLLTLSASMLIVSGILYKKLRTLASEFRQTKQTIQTINAKQDKKSFIWNIAHTLGWLGTAGGVAWVGLRDQETSKIKEIAEAAQQRADDGYKLAQAAQKRADDGHNLANSVSQQADNSGGILSRFMTNTNKRWFSR